jgi:hypothetical protein
MKTAFEAFLCRVRDAGNIKIYGAGKLARSLYLLFHRLGISVDAFVVEDVNGNPRELYGKPVISLEEMMLRGNYSLVAGMEKRQASRTVINMLMTREVQNIIAVPYDSIQEIYCGFVIDGSSPDELCKTLSSMKRVILYVNDMDGGIAAQYLQARGVRIHAVCTDLKEFPVNFPHRNRKVLSVEQLPEGDDSSTVLLTMGDPWQQSRYISCLRNRGYEKIILMSKEIKRKIKEEYQKLVWEENGEGFRVMENCNVEEDHYAVQRMRDGKEYRWRVHSSDQFFCSEDQMEAVGNGGMFAEYERQYPGFNYLSCTEVPLCEVDEDSARLQVYMVRFHRDKKIESFSLPDWITQIQAGAALTTQLIGDIRDDTGYSISARNTDYSEGTALYWIWKNTQGPEYVGLFHYRRQMAMGKNSLKDIMQYDVVLTVPSYVPEGTRDFFCRRFIFEYDWNLMMRFIGEYDQAYYETALAYEKAHCYFPCNIFIMKRKYFDEMCSFIFGITEKVDAFYQNMGLVRKDRYMGFLVENLLSIYIMHHGSRLKGAYMDMKYYAPLED